MWSTPGGVQTSGSGPRCATHVAQGPDPDNGQLRQSDVRRFIGIPPTLGTGCDSPVGGVPIQSFDERVGEILGLSGQVARPIDDPIGP